MDRVNHRVVWRSRGGCAGCGFFWHVVFVARRCRLYRRSAGVLIRRFPVIRSPGVDSVDLHLLAGETRGGFVLLLQIG